MEPEDQADGTLPDGLFFSSDSTDVLPETTVTLANTIWADNDVDPEVTLVLRLVSDENPDGWGKVNLSAAFVDYGPVLTLEPVFLETGVMVDDTVMETVVLKNEGTGHLEDVTIGIVAGDGSPAPSWVHLNSDENLGDLAPGEDREVNLSFSPGTGVDLLAHLFILKVTPANLAPQDILVSVNVTGAGIGSVFFKVTDIYTGTVGLNGYVVQGLSDARIRVSQENDLATDISPVSTDYTGEAQIEDLAEGSYQYRIFAPEHKLYSGRFFIKPGVTTVEQVFLPSELVTIEWRVTPVTFTDSYSVETEVHYETDVPAPVVVIEPANVNLPDMIAGDVFHGEFTITNYGLVRADNVTYKAPSANAFYRYELMPGLPEVLEAGESVSMPFRVTCLNTFDGQDGTGGEDEAEDCSSSCGSVDYDFTCAGGDESEGWCLELV